MFKTTDNTVHYTFPEDCDKYNFNKHEEQNSRCLHDSCPECNGTGRKPDGTLCVHAISCPCPKCSPRC